MSERGKFIVIEGHDGTGKSAQRNLLTDKLRTDYGIQVVHTIEPGGTPISNDIRDVIKNGELERDALTNILLFSASRRESWNQVVKPALESGIWVISDRNWYSTIVYQGYGEGADYQLIEDTTRLFVGDEYLDPDIAVVLALKNETERKKRAEASADVVNDTFEQKDPEFQRRVTEGYIQAARKVGAIVVEFSETETEQDVHEMIWSRIASEVESGITNKGTSNDY